MHGSRPDGPQTRRSDAGRRDGSPARPGTAPSTSGPTVQTPASPIRPRRWHARGTPRGADLGDRRPEPSVAPLTPAEQAALATADCDLVGAAPGRAAGGSDLHLTAGRRRRSGSTAALRQADGLPSGTPTRVRAAPPPCSRRAGGGLRARPRARLRVRVSGRAAVPGELLDAARLDGGGVPGHPARHQGPRGAGRARRWSTVRRPAARPRAGHRPDRLGQVDDARRADRPRQPHPRRPHHHDRGPDRVPARAQASRWSTSARSAPTRTVFAAALQARAAPGPRRHPRRRAARPRDDLDGADRGRDRSPRLRDAAHAGRRADDRPHHRRVPAAPAGAGARAARRRPCRASSARRSCARRDGQGRVDRDRGARDHARDRATSSARARPTRSPR